jgi:hypothetical protein
MSKYRSVLSSIADAELLLRVDKKFNSETYVQEVSKVLEHHGLKYNKIEAKESSYSLSIYIDNQSLSNWVFENTKEKENA